jgi:hypothetical protein
MHVAIGKYDKGGPCKQYRVRMELLDIYNRERERERERERVRSFTRNAIREDDREKEKIVRGMKPGSRNSQNSHH